MQNEEHNVSNPEQALLRETRDKVIESATKLARIELDLIELKAQSIRETSEIKKDVGELKSFRVQVVSWASALGAAAGAMVSFITSWAIKHLGGPPHA